MLGTAHRLRVGAGLAIAFRLHPKQIGRRLSRVVAVGVGDASAIPIDFAQQAADILTRHAEMGRSP